ncbi:unnamed protein product [Rotaria sordida]|uniref:Uncharacterized protein n=1 Tax=Rotaria sordida TaxID=392033 RepID=A0A814RID9_9BILA|nr:unnamed protein product [Rotaria sordida]CAF1361176.1 unnamed protein product [Rotaria sordida]
METKIFQRRLFQTYPILESGYNYVATSANSHDSRNHGQLRPLDSHGCDAMVRSCGNKGKCCDVHDACYKRHGCTASSWFLLWGNCATCNRDVMGCVAFNNPGKSTCCAARNCGQARP